MKPHIVLFASLAVILVFVLGVIAGVWFVQHYRIVPIAETAPAPPQSSPQEIPEASGPSLPPRTLEPASEKLPQPDEPPAGLFTYRFVEGETDYYTLTVEMEGKGIDLGQGSDIGLYLNSGMKLTTENVDPRGRGKLRLDFTEVDMTGDFMGSSVELHQGAKGGRFEMGSGVDVGKGLMPQLEFFKQPIYMTVAPDGQVSNVSGVEGFDKMLMPMTRLLPPAMQNTDIQPGAQWQSEFLMPVPGLTDGVNTTAQNTFVGYTQINGVPCAVVQQKLTSNQTQGTIAGIPGKPNEPTTFSLPELELTGENLIYADASNGKLVRCDIDLELKLEIGQALQPIAELSQMLNEALGETQGARPSQNAPSANNLGIGVRIWGVLAKNPLY